MLRDEAGENGEDCEFVILGLGRVGDGDGTLCIWSTSYRSGITTCSRKRKDSEWSKRFKEKRKGKSTDVPVLVYVVRGIGRDILLASQLAGPNTLARALNSLSDGLLCTLGTRILLSI